MGRRGVTTTWPDGFEVYDDNPPMTRAECRALYENQWTASPFNSDEIEAKRHGMSLQQIMTWISQFGMDAFKSLPARSAETRMHRTAGWRQKRRRKRERQTGRR